MEGRTSTVRALTFNLKANLTGHWCLRCLRWGCVAAVDCLMCIVLYVELSNQQSNWSVLPCMPGLSKATLALLDESKMMTNDILQEAQSSRP